MQQVKVALQVKEVQALVEEEQDAESQYGGSPYSGGGGGGGIAEAAEAAMIVCTMMNESYGFGSFRNKIWLKHSKGLAPEYQKGYHIIIFTFS